MQNFCRCDDLHCNQDVESGSTLQRRTAGDVVKTSLVFARLFAGSLSDIQRNGNECALELALDFPRHPIIRLTQLR